MYIEYSGIMLAVIGIGATVYYGRKALTERSKKLSQKITSSDSASNQSIDNSPGSIQIAGDGNVANINPPHAAPVPEVSLEIYGDGSRSAFTSNRLINRSSQALVAEEITIMGVSTALNQQFRNMFAIQNASFPPEIFTAETEAIPVTVTYRTLAGERYQLSIVGTQEYRQGDGRYNVQFSQPSSSERL